MVRLQRTIGCDWRKLSTLSYSIMVDIDERVRLAWYSFYTLFEFETIHCFTEKFEQFLRSFFIKFTHKSVDTNDFKSHLMTVYKGTSELKSIHWDQWLFSPGMPHIIPE